MDMTMWDKIPEEMQLYLSRHGRHFNKRLCEFAARKMRKIDSAGTRTKITPYTREEVEAMLGGIGKTLEDYDAPYDAIYVANMAKSDFLGSSLPDTAHVAQYVDDVMSDPDAYDGMVLNRWLADMAGKGTWIDWERMV